MIVRSPGHLAWRSAVVPVAATGRVRLMPPDPSAIPRERAIEAMVHWCQAGDRPVWLVEGPPGAGKSSLLRRVADWAVAQRWPCGYARVGMGSFAITTAAQNGKRALLLIDDAETRADMYDVLACAANGGRPMGVRIIVAARHFGAWWNDLLARLPPAERDSLTAGRTVMGRGTVTAPASYALVQRGVNASGVKGRAATTLSLADPASPMVLLRQAAMLVALSTRVGRLAAADVRSALRDLFEEEEGFWQRAEGEVAAPGRPVPALRAALACAAVGNTEAVADAATVVRRVPALAAGAATRLARLAIWWHGLFARAGEYETLIPRLPSWLADRLPDGTDSTGISWAVAALDAERKATSTLARLAVDAHRDIWPQVGPSPNGSAGALASLRRVVSEAAPIDEALAWLIQELELSEDDMAALSEALSGPARTLCRTSIALTRRMLDTCDSEDERAILTLTLGARLSEVGRWDEARRQTERAVEMLRKLAELDRERYLPDLATAVLNLGSCLAHLGERDDALSVTYEAVALHRELVDADRDRYLPALAKALTNLSACLSRAGHRPAALGAAGQAVAIYRDLVEMRPSAFEDELAAADHNWRVLRESLGQPVAGRPPS